MASESPDMTLTDDSAVGLPMPIILTVQPLDSTTDHTGAQTTLLDSGASVVTTTTGEMDGSILMDSRGYIGQVGDGETMHRVVYINTETLTNSKSYLTFGHFCLQRQTFLKSL